MMAIAAQSLKPTLKYRLERTFTTRMYEFQKGCFLHCDMQKEMVI